MQPEKGVRRISYKRPPGRLYPETLSFDRLVVD